jgi:ParB-like chromosome segregation protein Spo0J
MPSVSRPIDPTQADIAFHPFADIFPMMDEVALAELAADIKAESQREPIHFWQDQIIDGRNRYAACKLAGVEPIIKKIEFPGGDAEALAYVLSRNLKRRHLSVTQRSDVARRLANMRQGERTDLAQPSDAGPKVVSQAEAANMLEVSPRSVGDAKVVHERGSPELIAAVEAGQTSLRKAAETVRRGAEHDAPERPKPAPAAFAPADVMVQMRLDAQRLKGADLGTLIAEWIMARIDVSLVIASKPEVMAQLGGGVAARSSISAWVKGDVLDSQRASLVKEAIASIRHGGERRKLIEELASGLAKPLHRERI